MRLAIFVGLVISCAACDRVTGPLGPNFSSPAAFARHVDSLYQGYGPAGDPQGTRRPQFLSYLEYGPAFGGTPTTVSVDGQKWRAYLWTMEDTNTGAQLAVVLAYRDGNVSAAFLGEIQTGVPTIGQGLVLYNNTLAVADSGQISFTRGGAVGPCTPVTGLTNPDMVLAATYSCDLESITVSVQATGQGVLNGKSSQTISFSATTTGPHFGKIGDT